MDAGGEVCPCGQSNFFRFPLSTPHPFQFTSRLPAEKTIGSRWLSTFSAEEVHIVTLHPAYRRAFLCVSSGMEIAGRYAGFRNGGQFIEKEDQTVSEERNRNGHGGGNRDVGTSRSDGIRSVRTGNDYL